MKQNTATFRLLVLPLLLALAVAVLDQATKLAVLNHFSQAHGAVEVTSFFNIVLVMNRGISFGLFGQAPAPDLFALLALAIFVALMLWLARAKSAFTACALGLLMGGAVGNTIDRLRLGAVVDFLDFHAFGQHWPSFNVADSAVVTGVTLLLLQTLVFDKKTRHSS